MWFTSSFLMLWLITVWLVLQLLFIRQPGERVKVNFSFPFPKRANMTVAFKAKKENGPFTTRVTLLRGKGIELTRDSVDGAPDADHTQLVAPLGASPFMGDGVHRSIGMVGIEAEAETMRGQLHVEVLNAEGKRVAAQVCDF